ncbi:MAG: hypothetical protein ACKV2T_15625 [Kofleriaceae bacterium]
MQRWLIVVASLVACGPKYGDTLLLIDDPTRGNPKPASCGDLGPAAPNSEKPLPPMVVDTSRYPYRVMFLDPDEVARRRAQLERRNPGLHVDVDRAGRVVGFHGRAMPCSTQREVQTRRYDDPLHPDDRAFIGVLFERNRDVIGAQSSLDTVTLAYYHTKTATPHWEILLHPRWSAGLTFAEQPDTALWRKLPPMANVIREDCPSRDGEGHAGGPCATSVVATFPTPEVGILRRETVIFRYSNRVEIRRAARLDFGEVPPVRDYLPTSLELSVGGLRVLDAVTGETIEMPPRNPMESEPNPMITKSQP